MTKEQIKEWGSVEEIENELIRKYTIELQKRKGLWYRF